MSLWAAILAQTTTPYDNGCKQYKLRELVLTQAYGAAW